jgi:hypothetical protein
MLDSPLSVWYRKFQYQAQSNIDGHGYWSAHLWFPATTNQLLVESMQSVVVIVIQG